MNILFTGVSSFTGAWIVDALTARGHRITAPLRRGIPDYDELRSARMRRLGTSIEVVEHCPFGSPDFVKLIERGEFDLLCQHGAQVDNYRSAAFDADSAFRDNCLNLGEVLQAGRRNPRFAVILTGTVFEQNEGDGTRPLRAFSPYGVSKGMTSDAFRSLCSERGVKLAKFVVPNPFGPYEEPRFCDYLMRCWSAGAVAEVRTPDYIRDNIHVSLLAAAYADLVARFGDLPGWSRFGPSQYIESQGDFARRFAREIGERLQLRCALNLLEQTEFPEPKSRFNTDRLDYARLGWDEAKAWDELAAYYRNHYPQLTAG
jgi:nucleoside-diphosphate-sugar epimerase